MKQLMILTIITYTFCSLAFAEVADYYFPGEVGSQWTFDIPGMPDVIYTRKTDLQLSGRTYHIVSETFPLLGGLSNDPFLAFRISQNQVLGFAKKANQMLADAFIQGLKEGGGGIIEGKIRFDSGDEWVLLNQEPEPGNEWNFAKWTVTIWDKRNPGNKIKGVILYRAAVKKRENIGRFQAMKIDYEMTAEFPKMQKLQEEMLTLWISRRVGIVQIGIPGQKTKACLTKYNIVSIKEAVKMTSDRLIATDNAKDAKVILNFTDALGNTWTKEAPEAVTIDTEIIIREANFDKVYVKNGEKVTLTVVTEPGATVTADVSDLHTDQTEAILLTETETPGTFDVDIKVNEENTAENGKRAIIIAASDAVGNSTTAEIYLKLNLMAFNLMLNTGVNLISVPLDPGVQWQMSDLADFIGPNLTIIIHYDNGKFGAYKPDFPKTSPANVTVKSDQGYIVVMKAPETLTFDGTDWDGAVSLSAGINLISMPVEPPEEMKLSDLLTKIGPDATMVIWYDTEKAKFVNYMPTFPEDSPSNTTVKGGTGYIIMMRKAKTVKFEGKAWEKTTETGAPDIVLQTKDLIRTPILAVEGNIFIEYIVGQKLNGIKITIRNLTTNQSVTNDISLNAGNGSYIATFVDLSGDYAASIGDVFEATIVDNTGTFRDTSIRHMVTPQDIQAGIVPLDIKLSPVPKVSILLANYPNPFNPDTWIPYQIAEDADVTIRIYNIKGQLVKTMRLGHKKSGFYLSKEKAAYWDGRNEVGERAASGVYFYTLQVGEAIPSIREFKTTRKMVIAK